MRTLLAAVLTFSAMFGVANSSSAQNDDPLPGWFYERVQCDVEMRTQGELIELGENPPNDLNVVRVAAEAQAFDEENDVAATPGLTNRTYTTFEEPDAEPVSDQDFASIQNFLRYLESCGELPSSLNLTALMTDDFAAFNVSQNANEEGLTVEQYVTQQSAATPQPSPSPNEYLNFEVRALWIPYQAWDTGNHEVLVTVGVNLHSTLEDYGDQATVTFPPPDDMIILVAIILERNGDSWLWADINASLNPALVNPRG